MANNRKPYSNSNSRAKRNNNRKNSYSKNYSNASKKKIDNPKKNGPSLEHTTRIRIDKSRLNDSESLDTSFLEGRRNTQKVKESLLKESKKRFISLTVIKNIFYLLSILCVLILAFLVFINNNQQEKPVKDNKEIAEEEKVEKSPVIDDNYLFVGDFHTEQFDFSNFGFDYHYVKSSEDDFTSKDVLENVRNAIYQYNPSIVFIELGINDLKKDFSFNDSFHNFKEIIDGIQENRPFAQIYLESVYPINDEHSDFDKDFFPDDVSIDDIIEFNKELKVLAASNKVHYLDVFSELSDNNQLKEDYTDDGIHLNEKGYEKIVEIINKVLDDEK